MLMKGGGESVSSYIIVNHVFSLTLQNTAVMEITMIDAGGGLPWVLLH